MAKKVPHEIARRDRSASEWANIAGTPLGMELFSYLSGQGRLPPIKRSFMGDGVNGRFTYGWEVPQPYITLSPYAGRNTGVHEAAHAADYALERQYYDRELDFGYPSKDSQYTKAYEKLKGRVRDAKSKASPRGYADPRVELADLFDKNWTNKNSGYRATHNELGGFAAGSTVPGGFDQSDYKPPLHLNSTLATELAILIDLAMREDPKYRKKK